MIRVRSLKKQFDKRGIAGIHDISFSLDKGEIVGIMGPNGSGKTTLLRMLNGSLPPDSGEVEVDGEIALFPSVDSHESINVQKFLVESVKLDIEDEKKIQLARDLADTFEFTFQLRQNLSELSSGQKQKVLLSKELINRPALLLMDEPFTHLDPFSRKEILKSLFEYIRHQEITLLWVTHDLDEALKFSDRIAVMNFGKIEQINHPLHLVQKPRNLFVAQFMGYRNFLPMRQGEEDALLIVPDSAWEISPKGNIFKVIERYAGKQTIEYVLEKESQKFYFIQGPQHKLLELGEVVSLRPRQEECLLIPL